MTTGQIPYAALVEGKLMEVVRDILRETATSGLPDPHHFYITFRTEHPGVEMPAELRARYRPEMTIVLQHQFWDLEVSDYRFEVTLSFSGRSQRLVIPYEAIKVFADPAVEFGLQFTLADADDDEDAGTVSDGEVAQVVDASDVAPATAPSEVAEADPTEQGEVPGESAEVVSLDRFRKR